MRSLDATGTAMAVGAGGETVKPKNGRQTSV